MKRFLSLLLALLVPAFVVAQTLPADLPTYRGKHADPVITVDQSGNYASPGAGGGPATIADGQDAAEGATTDPAATAGGTGSLSAKLRLITSQLNSISTAVAALQVGLPYSPATQPVSGTVTVQQSTAANLKVDLSGTAANATAVKVDNSAVTQPVSATALPLPTGAATAAKQPALGTAGTPSADVITVQGATSGTALKTDPSGVTSPVSLATNTPIANVGSGAGGIASSSYLASAAASTNATSVKASPGRLYKVCGYNGASALRYLKLYNKASAPTVGTDTPLFRRPLPPGGFCFDWMDIGAYFSTGIAYALTTGNADADTGALTAADIVALSLEYN
jgi:hypothetical protein